jgi:hypothetical protein
LTYHLATVQPEPPVEVVVVAGTRVEVRSVVAGGLVVVGVELEPGLEPPPLQEKTAGPGTV